MKTVRALPIFNVHFPDVFRYYYVFLCFIANTKWTLYLFFTVQLIPSCIYFQAIINITLKREFNNGLQSLKLKNICNQTSLQLSYGSD